MFGQQLTDTGNVTGYKDFSSVPLQITGQHENHDVSPKSSLLAWYEKSGPKQYEGKVIISLQASQMLAGQSSQAWTVIWFIPALSVKASDLRILPCVARAAT